MKSASDRQDRILIVDDMHKNIQVLGSILRDNGYLVNVAQSGIQAIEILEQVLPEIILLDVMMPEMDGFTACRKIKERPEWAEIPIIFLTAKVDSEDIVEGFEAGASDYVTKPFNSVELLARVRTHIELKQSRQYMRERLETLVAERTEQLKNETEEKIKLKEQLMQGQKLEALGQLAGGVAHDFNNQLTGIIGSLDLIKEFYDDDDRIMKYIDIIYQASVNSTKLIEKLLAFAKKSVLSMDLINIDDLMNDLVAIVSRSISKSITIRTDFSVDSKYVKGDFSLLENALLNLSINASHAMAKGGVLDISTKNVFLDADSCRGSVFRVRPGEYIRISVRDTGSGIDQETLKHIFEPFFTTKVDKGTGLGLSAVYSTVEEHHGTITVDSEPGIGSDFSVFLPVSETLSRDDQKEQDDFFSRKINVMIADDDVSSVSVTKELLNGITENCFTAVSEREIIDIYSENSTIIDVVIVNQGMQRREGVDLYYMLREINPGVTAIISSGYGFSNETVRILEKIGIRGFLKKPFNRKLLLTTIKGVLQEANE